MKLQTKQRKIILLAFILFPLFLLSSCETNAPLSNINKNHLIIHYIDVGQGDSMLIQIHGKNMLIDAGTTESTNELVNYLKKQRIDKLDYVIETHPHEDHIGAMSKIINKFEINKFYGPKITANTKAFENMVDSLKSKSLKINVAKAGQTIDLGSDIKCKIIAPNSDAYKEINNYSVVIKLEFGNTSFLFEGDAEKISETEMITKGYNLSCDVLKIGHHGSRTATSDEFLKETHPKISIISCGLNNDYGHPHKPTLTKLNAINSKIYRTNKDGTVILESDGIKISKK
ncbi:MAG: MBL fold metallo-hydrolase [Clostridiaceae bacterium]|nr:MBL fold metallo-hydrolase [Clostridiaceae bacterium]